MNRPARTSAYGQGREPTLVDRFGVWLSGRAVRRSADLAGARVADFGCGYEARFARGVADVVASITVVDVALDPALAEIPRIEPIEAPIERAIPALGDRSFDLILCLSVLEHLWEPQATLDGFSRLLAPGGKLLVNVPSWRGKRLLEFSAFRLGASPAEEMDDHKRYYDPRDLWPMLVAAGFAPSRIHCHRHKFGLNTFAVCTAPADEGDTR